MKILELESAIIKMKNSLKAFNGRFDLYEEEESVNLKISQLRLFFLKNIKNKRMKINTQSFRDLWDIITCTNICIMEL